MTKERDYKKEYEDYHGKPSQIARRSERNKSRRRAGLKKGDPREVHHVDAPRTGPLPKKTRVVSQKTNRSIQPKRS